MQQRANQPNSNNYQHPFTPTSSQQQIPQNSLANNEYNDPSFPHIYENIYDPSIPLDELQQVIWMACEELHHRPYYSKGEFSVKELLEDMTFVSRRVNNALTMMNGVGGNERLYQFVKERPLNNGNNSETIKHQYTFNIFLQKQWTPISIDSYVPVSQTRNRQLFAQNLNGCLFPCLIEKLLAKIAGGYQNIASLGQPQIIELFLGYPIERIRINQMTTTVGRERKGEGKRDLLLEKQQVDMVYDMVYRNVVKRRSLMCFRTLRNAILESFGLVPNKCYWIVGVKDHHNGQSKERLVTFLQFPQGSNSSKKDQKGNRLKKEMRWIGKHSKFRMESLIEGEDENDDAPQKIDPHLGQYMNTMSIRDMTKVCKQLMILHNTSSFPSTSLFQTPLSNCTPLSQLCYHSLAFPTSSHQHDSPPKSESPASLMKSSSRVVPFNIDSHVNQQRIFESGGTVGGEKGQGGNGNREEEDYGEGQLRGKWMVWEGVRIRWGQEEGCERALGEEEDERQVQHQLGSIITSQGAKRVMLINLRLSQPLTKDEHSKHERTLQKQPQQVSVNLLNHSITHITLILIDPTHNKITKSLNPTTITTKQSKHKNGTPGHFDFLLEIDESELKGVKGCQGLQIVVMAGVEGRKMNAGEVGPLLGDWVRMKLTLFSSHPSISITAVKQNHTNAYTHDNHNSLKSNTLQVSHYQNYYHSSYNNSILIPFIKTLTEILHNQKLADIKKNPIDQNNDKQSKETEKQSLSQNILIFCKQFIREFNMGIIHIRLDDQYLERLLQGRTTTDKQSSKKAKSQIQVKVDVNTDIMVNHGIYLIAIDGSVQQVSKSQKEKHNICYKITLNQQNSHFSFLFRIDLNGLQANFNDFNQKIVDRSEEANYSHKLQFPPANAVKISKVHETNL